MGQLRPPLRDLRAGVDEASRRFAASTSRSPSTSSISTSRHAVDGGAPAACRRRHRVVGDLGQHRPVVADEVPNDVPRRAWRSGGGRVGGSANSTSLAIGSGTPPVAAPSGAWVSRRSSAATDSLRCQPASPPPVRRRSARPALARRRSTVRRQASRAGARADRSARPGDAVEAVEPRQSGAVGKDELHVDLVGCEAMDQLAQIRSQIDHSATGRSLAAASTLEGPPTVRPARRDPGRRRRCGTRPATPPASPCAACSPGGRAPRRRPSGTSRGSAATRRGCLPSTRSTW